MKPFLPTPSLAFCRVLVLVFLLVSQLFAAGELEYIDRSFATASPAAKLALHNQLKSLYIKALINDDAPAKLKILKRLITTAKALGLDAAGYEEDLEESQAEAAATTPAVANSSPAKKELAKKEEPKEEAKKEEKAEKIFLLKSSKISGGIRLVFSSPVSVEDLHSSVLDEPGNYRQIIDFDAALEGGRVEWHFDDFYFVLSQYNPKTVRLVLRAKAKVDLKIGAEGKNLDLLATPVATPAPAAKPASPAAKVAPAKTPATKPAAPAAKKSSEKPPYILTVAKVQSGGQRGIRLRLSEDFSDEAMSVISSQERTRQGRIYRKIITLPAALEGNRRNFSFANDTVSVSQYTPQLVRIVFNSRKNFEVASQAEGRVWELFFAQPVAEKKPAAKASAAKAPVKKEPAKKEPEKPAKKEAEKPAKKEAAKPAPKMTNKYKKVIVIDPGHGGKDGGAISDKKATLKEKDIVLSAGLRLGAELKKRGYTVFYTREKDEFINLRDRTSFANAKNADLFISIHANAAPSPAKAKYNEGLETFFLSPARSERSKEAAAKENQGDFEEINYFSQQSILNFFNREKIVASNKLAIDIQQGVLASTRKAYKVVDGGVREAPFWVLVGAQMPAILIEIGYITHPSEGKRIANKNYQALLVRGIADGVDNYFYHNR